MSKCLSKNSYKQEIFLDFRYLPPKDFSQTFFSKADTGIMSQPGRRECTVVKKIGVKIIQ
jgi:hypothetical protein